MPSIRKIRYMLAQAADDFARFTADVIYDRRHDRAAELMASFLYGLSFFFPFDNSSASFFLRFLLAIPPFSFAFSF